MSDDSLIEAMPDFVAFMRRDGVVLRHLGGRQLGLHQQGESLNGSTPEEIWEDSVAQRIKQTVRRSLANRGTETLEFERQGRRFQAQVSARGRERVLCVIRENLAERRHGERDGVRSGATERREFFDRLKSAVADSSLRERRLAVGVVHFDGLAEIGASIDYSVSQDVVAALLQRLGSTSDSPDAAGWNASCIGEGVFGMVAHQFVDRLSLRDAVTRLLQRLREPIAVGDASFSLRPSIGIAILGEDGNEPGALLDHAQSAMQEARRTEAGGLNFYSDSLQLRSLQRLDLQREMREAVAADAFALRYSARRDLVEQRLTAVNAYLRWPSELRRETAPAKFLPLADSTGMALDLSRWALGRLRRDIPALRALNPGEFRVSFGPLRQHFASGALLADVSAWLSSGEIHGHELELRLSERVLASLNSPGRVLQPLHDLGVRLVVDEFGRGYSALPRLARMPLWGLQVDRSLITGAASDAVAERSARAALALAQALGLVPIASGIDAATDVQRWRDLGCAEGLGDHFGASLQLVQPPDVAPALPAASARRIVS